MATPPHIVSKALLKPSSPNATLVDLGSGDGRLVIHAARLGYRAVGYEMNWVLFISSYASAARAGVLHRVSFRMRDFWQSDLTGVSHVTCFGVKGVMERLNQKLSAAAVGRSKADPITVILFRFPLPEGARRNLVSSNTTGELFVYRFPI